MHHTKCLNTAGKREEEIREEERREERKEERRDEERREEDELSPVQKARKA